jgi:5-methylcytosine-specific restriction endonuclease McrA
MINHIKDIVQGKAKVGEKRSSRWSKIRKEHLKKQPNCTACGGNKALEVHHIKPFNSNPELELNPNNLITLCEAKNNGVNCHLLFGHLGNFKSINPNSVEDSATWLSKIKGRI